MSLLTRRLETEVRGLASRGNISLPGQGPDLKSFPLVLDIVLHSPGPVLAGDCVEWTSPHRVEVIVGRDYPYAPPIVRWRSGIFHPNIMSPEDGGYVCVRSIVDWDFSRDIGSLLDGLVAMLANPNPGMALGSGSCRLAARYFSGEGSGIDGRVTDAR